MLSLIRLYCLRGVLSLRTRCLRGSTFPPQWSVCRNVTDGYIQPSGDDAAQCEIQAPRETRLEAHLEAHLEANLEARLKAHLEARLEAHLAARLEARLEAHLEAHLEANLE